MYLGLYPKGLPANARLWQAGARGGFVLTLLLFLTGSMINKKILILCLSIALVILLVIFWSNFHKKPIDKPNPTIVFVGDSMTEYLGNFDELRAYLKNYYPTKNFLLLNYGFSSTNILSLQDRLEKDSSHSGRTFQAINNILFDFILIESFGHNPLSEYSLEKGLQLQTEALDKMMTTITQKHPKQSIIFVATIAPNRERYAEGAVNLTTKEREKWADERISYIKNHIEYAKSKSIPLINIYEKSLDQNGTGNIDYVNTNDFIHPSPTGIYFISEEIAKFLYNNKFF